LPDSQFKGFAAAGGAFLIWGLVPLYWKMLAQISAFELILHRIIWSILLLLVLIVARGHLRDFAQAFARVGSLGKNALAGLLLSANWFVFIWAVNADRVIDTSLGYFLVPFVSTGLGVFFLHERLNRIQLAAMGLALAGVALEVIRFGSVPWVGVALATSFGLYGLLRKQSPLGSLTGLGVETALLTPLALGILLFLQAGRGESLGEASALTHVLLVGTGLVTAVPLLLFSAGARLIPLSSIGLMQFLTPSITLLLGIFLYREPFPPVRLASFFMIWLGLAIYLAVVGGRRMPKRPPS
jgi:chloramphenicol-sensitive protein RarD